MSPTSHAKPSVRRRRAAGIALGWLHVLPDFLIIGAARSGTTALITALRTHPNVMPGPGDELHYFDTNRLAFGIGWYRRHFPTRARKLRTELRGRRPAITGENSPYYLADEAAPANILAAVPDARLIALLREPAARAASHWRLRTANGKEKRPFDEAVDAELAALTTEEGAGASGSTAPGKPRPGMARRAARPIEYVGRGIYLPQLQRWHGLVPREQLLIVPSEQWFSEPMDVLTQVWAHLGIPARKELPPMKRNRRGKDLPVDPATLERLRAFYAPHNAALEAYLGTQLGWDSSGSSKG